ncbi:hypothetical protein [Amycolatopsis sp. SID8362]|uniref:hypothetical protein n=1 Tax=Amycolatopsis sp. SID8362 TaxID=2690346 RepID=UPI00136F4397|nr:hypothetical protein [Amycolatopsis sp. SID8362]NBH03278.1 hypothetical protein [Amycolatopsis sp. SID8362]NED39979.1 hypothetical protein [Amycolatopsis sp. SID8362]
MAQPHQPQDPDDRRLETHPDLMNPDWQKFAERDAWLGAKKDLRKRRKREQRAGGFQRPGQSRWPGVLALLVVAGLVAAALIVHQIQGVGVNEDPFVFFGS